MTPGALALGAVVAAVALGWLAPQHPALALGGGAAVLILGVTSLDSGLVPLLCLPMLYVTQRIGAGGVDLSVSDAALALGTLLAVSFGSHAYSPPLRALLWLTAAYQAATLFTVIANPYPANTIEWFHAWFLTGGALILGWAVGRGRHGRTALRLMLLAACVLSGWVLLHAGINLTNGSTEPVYLPYGLHKNFLGTVIGTTALIAYVRPVWLGIHRPFGAAIFWWLALGLAATQSRQAIIALAVTLLVLVFRSHTERRRSKSILLVIIPSMAIVLTLVREQIASGNEFNSYFTRLTWLRDSMDIWSTNPIVGHGLRWWFAPEFIGNIQPPNAEIEVLTSAGLLGLLGFLVLMVGSIMVLRTVPPTYGTLAMLVLLSRFVQSQFDAFWTAGQVSIPFVIAGVCLGVHALREADGIATGAPVLAGEKQDRHDLDAEVAV
ncbi:O-antigen ligase family protein [Janibacter sp. GS2]|uniref:O-antigen ligase family protein n=1 Tax=Janibacter sp. GS2 TaxID=3442646 RepID=UPI003EC0816F